MVASPAAHLWFASPQERRITMAQSKGLIQYGDNRVLITLEIDGLPPTVNMMYRGLHGHRFKTQDTLAYQNYVTDKLRKLWHSRPPYDGRAEFAITYHTHSRRRWDIDNRVKALQDCLSLAGVIKDDSQIDKLMVERIFELDNPRDYTILTLLKSQ